MPNLCRRYLLVAVDKHSRAREDVQPLDFGQLGNDVFCDAIAKVLIFLRPAEVLEIEDSYRFCALFDNPRARFARISRPLVTGINITLEPDQVGLEVGSGLIAQISVFFQSLFQDASESRRQGWIHLHDGNWVAVENRFVNHGRGIALKGEEPGRHLIESRSQGEQVGSSIDKLSARLLWRHV